MGRVPPRYFNKCHVPYGNFAISILAHHRTTSKSTKPYADANWLPSKMVTGNSRVLNATMATGKRIRFKSKYPISKQQNMRLGSDQSNE